MQSIVSYQKQQELLKLSFLKKKKASIICPSPQIADDIRERLRGIAQSTEFETITISKFISDLLGDIGIESRVWRKSELMLDLATIWKAKFADKEEGLFHYAFNQVTELRSFSLDTNLLEEVLKEGQKDLSEVTSFFLKYMEARDICDEQKSYDKIITHLSSEHLKTDESYIFLGFTHLSLLQIELIRAISRFADIFVPIPKLALDKSSKVSWIEWMREKSEIIELEESNDLNQLKMITFSKNRLAISLGNYLEEKNEEKDLFLAEKSPRFSSINEISFNDAYFKVESDQLSIVVESLIRDLKKKLFDKEEKLIQASDIIRILDEEIQNYQKKFLYRPLKVILLLKKEILSWIDLSEINETLGEFDINILSEVMTLNLPRVFNIPINGEAFESSIRGFDGLWALNSDRCNIFCVTSSHNGLTIKESLPDPKVAKILMSLGPMRSSELDFYFYKSQVIELLSSENSTLFIEDGVVERDLVWNDIVSSFQSLKSDHSIIENKRKAEDCLAPVINSFLQRLLPVEKIGPSRLQTYIECPRKYFFNYIAKINDRIDQNERLETYELGEIEHEAVQSYLSSHKSFDEDSLGDLCHELLTKNIEEKGKKLGPSFFQQYWIEIFTYSKILIKELLKLYVADPKASFYFEVPLKSEFYKGRIDCLVKFSDETVAIFDFKRSGNSIPTMKSFENFEKIQLWVYLSDQLILGHKVRMTGYLNMAEAKESLIFDFLENEEGLSLNFFYEETKRKKLKEDLSDAESSFRSFFKEKLCEIQEDKIFKASPLSADACLWCPVSYACDRGESHL